jgi:hypothetical protein
MKKWCNCLRSQTGPFQRSDAENAKVAEFFEEKILRVLCALGVSAVKKDLA